MEPNTTPEDQGQIEKLAERASGLMGRRALLRSTGRALILPALLSIGVSREALGNCGSAPVDGQAPNPGSGGGGETGGNTNYSHDHSRRWARRRRRKSARRRRHHRGY